jgi:hypothetical protein
MRKCYISLLMLSIITLLLTFCSDSSTTSPTTTSTAPTTTFTSTSTSTTSTTSTSSTTTVSDKPVVIRETGEGFNTIGEAITAASAGQHIDVSAGSYPGNLLIDKQLYLIGADRNTTIINGECSWHVVQLSSLASGSDIRGFTIRYSAYAYSGIFTTSSDNTIESVIVESNYTGIEGDGFISGVLVQDNSYGMVLFDPAGTLSINKSIIQKNIAYGIACYSGNMCVFQCNIINNFSNGILCSNRNNDLGGGTLGSLGYNIIRNNGEWDLRSSTANVKAEYNCWDHNTANEIDSMDIHDDDESSILGAVDFEPFLIYTTFSSLRMKPRLLTVFSLFKDFLRSLFRGDLPVSAVYISPSVEAKTDFSRYELIRARYHPLADERYYPPLKLRADR